MQNIYRWASTEGVGTEYLTLDLAADGALAKGVVVGDRGGQPYGLVYSVELDAEWRTREVRITRPADDEGEALGLASDGEGRWHDLKTGEHLPMLDGCIDVDIAATPFTNTLPIRRCPWRQGQVRTFSMAYVSVPELVVSKVAQRYTCLDENEKFLYENVTSDFQAELEIDKNGVVIDYPSLFRRLP